MPAKTEGINLQRVAKKLGLMNFNQVQTVLYESLIIFSMLTFVQRDDRVDDLSHRERRLLLLRVLPAPDEPPIQEEDQHRHHLDQEADADVSEEETYIG